MHQLDGRIQHYAWGGNTYISRLFSVEFPGETPCAEYWLGIHEGGPTRVKLSDYAHTTLRALIGSDREKYLGKKVAAQFGKLPYLLKILDVKDMLSIQVHPNKADALAGYKRENEAGIDLKAPNRNYKDDNHKPELMIALSDFWLLHGFSPDITTILEKHDFLHCFKQIFKEQGIKGLYQEIMTISQSSIDDILKPLSERIVPIYDRDEIEKSNPDFWAARAMKTFTIEGGKYDRGIFSIYLFNILHLKPGQVIFQGAGMPHAYMEGQNIELMSNSDNVLRAGLTPKHIDIPELMSNTIFEPTYPSIVDGDLQATHQEFKFSVPDFKLDIYHLEANTPKSLLIDSPSIFLSLHGQLNWASNLRSVNPSACAIFVAPGEQLDLISEIPQTIFQASVPLK
jgi:mannose-6-phosphate isomerase